MSGPDKRPQGWPAEWIVDGDPAARPLLVLAHGAGAPMDSPFMNVVARGLAARGRCVVRFEFDYMSERRRSGRRPSPGRAEGHTGEWLRVIEQAGDPARTVIGGKSMGGRVASLVADQAGVAGLVCLGYPFHPPGQTDKLRVAHLESLRTPALIVQGSRDAFGSREEVQGYVLAPSIRVLFLEAGDHSFKPPRGAAESEARLLERAIAAVDGFLSQL
jgi:predicted alpha/beta-hydrolase family hydrolase